jgi:hypothetical protein
VIQGLVNLANAHELLPTLDPTRVTTQDGYVQTNLKDFISYLTATNSSLNTSTYSWKYLQAYSSAEQASHGIHG